jgi:hypothetical protein
VKTLLIFFAISCCLRANELSLEDVSPHFLTNAEIVWSVPTGSVPERFWVYKRRVTVFSAATISNAVVLASFQSKGFPKPSIKEIVVWADRMQGEPRPPYLAMTPTDGTIAYSLGDRAPDSLRDIRSDATAIEDAWNCLGRLGVDRSQLIRTNDPAQGVRGVYFPRQVDGVRFFDDTEGFEFQRLKDGRIRGFFLSIPKLQRLHESTTASPREVIACIRAFKTPLKPNGERNYFGEVNNLARAKKVTITKLTPYYGEGVFGEPPTNNDRLKLVLPVAELEAVAEFGNSNSTLRLYSPILSSEAHRLLGSKAAR